MNRSQQFLQTINEKPYLNPRRKELEVLGSSSMEALVDRFIRLADVPGGYRIYENIEHRSILVGFPDGDRFSIVLRLIIQPPHLPVKKMQLLQYKQVSMVSIDSKHADSRIARKIYTHLATQFDLVSDRYQYLGAKTLWQSAAKEGRVHVYVYDLTARDYLRKDGNVIKYDGRNIDENLIWGQKPYHDERLLVASVREFV